MPVDPAEQLSLFEVSTGIGATIIDLAMTSQRHSRLSEQFAELLAKLKAASGQLASARTLEGLAEMAAGAAHELNNPLAVISGRAQLLFDSETDDNKKQMLGQIQDRAKEISQIVADLMSFARPTAAAPKLNSVRILIDTAISRTCEKHKIKKMEVEFSQVDNLGEVNVDKNQVVTAIANVLSNALDSYKGGSGPIRIDGGCEQLETSAAFQVIDTGAGMDSQTLQKATQPFFSVREAGRKRGMGLAHAQRLLRLNNGSINLASAPDEGTTVTIQLPRE
jgi:signal transduction histidine kinase